MTFFCYNNGEGIFMDAKKTWSTIGHAIVYAALAASAYAAFQNILQHRKEDISRHSDVQTTQVSNDIAAHCNSSKITAQLLEGTFSSSQLLDLHTAFSQIQQFQKLYKNQKDVEKYTDAVNLDQETCQAVEGYLNTLDI